MIDEREPTQGNIFGNNEGFGALFDDLEESQADGFGELGWSNNSNRMKAAKPSAGNSEIRDDSLSRNQNRMDEEFPDLVVQQKAFKDEQRKTIFSAIERIEPSKFPPPETRVPAEVAEFRSSFISNMPRMTHAAVQPPSAPKPTAEAPKPVIAVAKQPAIQQAFVAKTLPQSLVCPKPMQNQPAGLIKDQNQASEPKLNPTAIVIGVKQQPLKLENTFGKIQGVSLINISRPAVDFPAARSELLKPSVLGLSTGVQPLRQMPSLINFASKLTPVANGLTALQKELPAVAKPIEASNYPPASAKLVKSNTGATFAIQPAKPTAATVPSLAGGGRTANNQPQVEGIS